MFGFGKKNRAEQIAKKVSTIIALQKYQDFKTFFDQTGLRSSTDLEKFDLYLNATFVFYLYLWLLIHPDQKFVDHLSNAVTNSIDREVSLATTEIVKFAPLPRTHPYEHAEVIERWLEQKLGITNPSDDCKKFFSKEILLQARYAFIFIKESMPEIGFKK